MVKVKRVYEKKQRGDGYRVLVDRLWPRGVSKSDLAFDEWVKDISPSDELRKSFAHDPKEFKTFRKKYMKELMNEDAQEEIERLVKRARKRNLTLLYAARDEVNNNAVVLKEVIENVQK